jgi:peptide chain release factor subunit 1
MGGDTIKVAAAVLAWNEEKLIEDCLKHLKPYVDYIVVLDGCSSDATAKVAERYADDVYLKPFYGSFAEERMFLQLGVPGEYPWVLHCDCDERFPEEFLKNMKTLIQANNVDAFRFPRMNAEKAGWPDYQVRLIKRWVVWRKTVHEIPWHPDLDKPMDQWSCKTLDEYPIEHIPQSEENRKTILQRWQKLERKKVLVAFLVRDGEKWLTKFFKNLDKLDYPSQDLTFAIIEGNSQDGSWQMLSDFASKHEGVWLKKIDLEETSTADRAEAVRKRASRLGVLRNKVIDEALKDEEYVFWLDSDIVEFPASLLRDLLKANVDIVAPYVLIEGSGLFYDTLAFRKDGLKFAPDLGRVQTVTGAVVGGLPDSLFEVDSVGTCMLVRTAVYRKGVRFPDSDLESEQVGFCNLARKEGFRVFADPQVRVFHAELPRYGLQWH